MARSSRSAGVGGLVEPRIAGRAVPREFFMVMLAAAPLGVTILVSLVYAALRWTDRSRRRGDEDDRD